MITYCTFNLGPDCFLFFLFSSLFIYLYDLYELDVFWYDNCATN